MKIGNNSNFDMMQLLMQMQNLRNSRLNPSTTNLNNSPAATQSRPTLTNPYGTPPDPLSFRNVGVNDHPQALTLTEGDLKFMQLRTCSTSYATAFLHGKWGHEPIGTSMFRQLLSESGVELPDDVRFDISLDRYGGVTITGLGDVELARRIEEALSYDIRVSQNLGTHVRSARVLEGYDINDANAFTIEQGRLMRIQSDLTNRGTSLHNLNLDENGRIQGLPQELYDKIYGDRTEWLSGMEEMEAKWENWNIDRIRDDIVHFLQNGTDHIPTPDLSLTFENGRITVN